MQKKKPLTFGHSREKVHASGHTLIIESVTVEIPRNHRTFRFPSPERKSENPASVARSPTKVIPGLSSTNVFTAASVTCNRQHQIDAQPYTVYKPVLIYPPTLTHIPVSSLIRPEKLEQAGSLVVQAAAEPHRM